MLTLDESAEDVVGRELGQGEKRLWVGRPRQGIQLRGSDIFLIPFSLMWGGFAIIWEVMAIVKGAPWFFALFGIPFVLVGLYLIFGRFWMDARQRSRTVYGVTSERVIIITEPPARRVKSLNLDTLSDVSLTERRDGSGTITFGPLPPFYNWYGGTGWPGMGYAEVPCFDVADEARQVYEILCDAQRKARRRM